LEADLAINFGNPDIPGGDAVRSGTLRIAFFGHDSTESTIKKRVRAFQFYGASVIGFMFSRSSKMSTDTPSWINVPLGMTYSRRFGDRSFKLFKAVAQIWRHRSLVRQADILYARNLDMLCIAVLSRLIARADGRVVYEALDIHPYLTENRPTGRVLRMLERRLLPSISLLVVSSPTFVSRYFEPIQGYRGPWYLLENKLPGFLAKTVSPVIRQRTDNSPWIIGWFGALRCRRSLALLSAVAKKLGNRVRVHIRGIPTKEEGITEALLGEICAQHSNIDYFGSYRNPDDLEQIYGAVDFAWSVDYSAAGFNSDWLIPNRVYESGLYGVPSIARCSTSTGDFVERQKSGWCFDEPFEANVSRFLGGLSRSSYNATVASLASRDRTIFADLGDTERLLEKLRHL
jgi:hypothetical protein